MHELSEPLDPTLTRIRADQIERWQTGDRVPVEDFLRDHPSLANNADLLLDLIYGEVLLREEAGEPLDVDDYVRRFPQLEEPLRRQLALHDALARFDTEKNDDAAVTPRHIDMAATTRNDSSLGDREPAAPRSWTSTIGNYEVIEEIGRGGMGIVYKARHRLLNNRLAAVKVLRGGDVTAEERARFDLEARAAAELKHPNIVPIYEQGIHEQGAEQHPFVALEYVEGMTLAKRLNGTPLPPHEAATLMVPLADAIAHAHRHGIVHRDLKPANVLLAACGLASDSPKITDFGLAKRLNVDSGQTRTGAIMGTPSYMAPEQAEGKNDRIGPASDIYALGAIFYEMLTGRPPFKADTVLNTLHQVVKQEPVPPRVLQPGVPRDLETICLKCLEKDPRRRYASAADLGADIQRFLNQEPIMARPVGWIERSVKWVHRRPALASLLGVSALALAALVGVWIYFTVQLQAEKDLAREQEQIATENALQAAKFALIENELRKKATDEADHAKKEATKALEQSKRAGAILKQMAKSVDAFVTEARAAKSEELTTGNTGTILFKLACAFARTSSTLRNDPDLAIEDRDFLADQYAANAVRLLNCAKGVKFFDPGKTANREQLAKNHDLDVLRNRPDFKNLLEELRQN